MSRLKWSKNILCGTIEGWLHRHQEEEILEAPVDAEKKFRELLSTITRLRDLNGCPWDRAQTKTDIGRYLIEESYEVIEALEALSPDHLREELGDLLFHILFLARMAEEAGEFDIADVLGEITAKMVRRHPHVFGDTKVDSVEEVRSNWNRIKVEEEHKRHDESLAFSGGPRFLPTLVKAQQITTQAAEAGFDWNDVDGVLNKVMEELAEFRVALEAKDSAQLQSEAGDLLLTMVNLCRFVRVDAESALRSSLRKFIDRFSHIERELTARGKTLADSSISEMDRIWEEAKKGERNR